jgi:TRAP-type C4-dicarboxylate transport system permease small subunit
MTDKIPTPLRWTAGHLEEVLGAALLAAMACLAMANVVARYILHVPLAFTEELEVNGLVWLTLFGTSSAFRRGRHLRMLFFQDKLSEKIRVRLNICISILAAGLFICLGYLGYNQLIDERFLEITSESLNIPQWLYTLCIPVGCTMIVLRIIERTIKDHTRQN